MKELVATITSKGQLTVPAEIRRTLGLKRGDKVVFRLENHDVTLAPATSRLAAGYQSVPALPAAKTWQEVEALVAEEQAARFRATRDATAAG